MLVRSPPVHQNRVGGCGLVGNGVSALPCQLTYSDDEVLCMKETLAYSLVSLLCFGLWGIFGKLSAVHIKAEHAIVYEAVGIVLVALVILVKCDFKLEIDVKGIGYSVLVGVCGIVGTLVYLLAITKGNAAVATFITALYPVLVLAFSYFVFNEPISGQQGVAIVCALFSIVLFALS